jgi:hypothetical protein
VKIYWFILGVLAVWRLTHLLNAEDGPWNLVVRLRVAAGEGFWAGLLDCFYCLSLWISAPLACLIGETWIERLLLWPALSGAAILMQRLAPDPMIEAPSAYQTEETSDVLWQESTTVSEREPRAETAGTDGR